MSPWNVRNTFFAWGVDFKQGVKIETPASNVDLASTILALKGVNSSELDGRVLVESLRRSPKKSKQRLAISPQPDPTVTRLLFRFLLWVSSVTSMSVSD
jgi:arylsulfatase A-like enzyme